MKRIPLLLTVTLMMTSCATIINKKEYPLDIRSDVKNSKVQINDTAYELPAKIQVRRSRKDLKFKLLADTAEREFTIKPLPNEAFMLGNLLWLEFSPIAYLIDYTSSKSFCYGKTVYLSMDKEDSLIIRQSTKSLVDYFHKLYPDKAGQINLVLSMPYINRFYLQPPFETPKSNTGFWGGSIGLEYYYKDNKYISLNASAASDFFAPVIGAVDIWGEYNFMSTSYVSLTNNWRYKRFSTGCGINYSKNIWDHRVYDGYYDAPPLRAPVKRVSEFVGITMNSYYQVGRYFFVGLVYRPSLLRIKPDVEYKYEHLISLDLAFKFRLKK